MTQELAHFARDGMRPFHHQTVTISDLDATQLLECYRFTVQALLVGAETRSLWHLKDWHWHDGILTHAQPLSFDEWMSWTNSEQDMRRAWKAEDHCHRTVYPDDYRWLLRFALWEEPEELNQMDLSGDQSIVDAVVMEATRRRWNWRTQLSTDWFISSGGTPTS